MNDPLSRTRQDSSFDDHEAYSLLVENVQDYAIFFVDTEGVITNWNVGVKRILEYDENEFVGQPAHLIFTPEDRALGVPERELACAAADGRAVDERWHLRRDGTRFWASGIMTALYTPAGELRGFCKIMRDFTDRKKSETERAARLEQEQAGRKQVEEAMALKDDFVSVVAHELRTPLNVILGWTSLLRAGALEGPALEQACDTIERNVQMQSNLVNDLLDVSRIVQDGLVLDFECTEVIPVVEFTVESLRLEADRRMVRVQLNTDPETGSVRADPSRLRQIITNLLTNAIKFTPENGTVEVRTERSADRLHISVCDSGIGISPEFLPHVFERYHQAEMTSTRRSGGLGLGLFITRSLVELHGGTLTATSEGKGRGSTFHVSLPLEEVDAHQTP